MWVEGLEGVGLGVKKGIVFERILLFRSYIFLFLLQNKKIIKKALISEVCHYTP